MKRSMRKSWLMIIISSIILLCPLLSACSGECVHDYGEWQVETAATCENEGVQKRVCNKCRYKDTEKIASLGHDWDDGNITIEPTCTQDGEKTLTCRNDSNHTKNETVKTPGHDWVADVIVKAATCLEEGLRSAECSVCHLTEKDQVIPKTDHDWDVNRTEPTCETKGREIKTCKVCEKVDDKDLLPTGHKYSGYKVVKEATKTEEGREERTCGICKKVDSRTIPMIVEKVKQDYTIKIERKNGITFNGGLGIYFEVYDREGTIVATPYTNQYNVAKFTAYNERYTVKFKDDQIPLGYIIEEYEISPEEPDLVIVLDAKLNEGLPPAGYTIKQGSVLFDLQIICDDGTKLQISDLLKQYKGIVLNFYFIDCPACNEEWPYFAESYEKYKKDIIVISLNTKDEDVPAIREHVREYGIPFVMARGETTKKYFDVDGAPSSYFIDCQGVVNTKVHSWKSFDSLFEGILENAKKLGM